MLDTQIIAMMHGLVHTVEVQWFHALVVCGVIAVAAVVNRSRAAGRIDKRYHY